MTTKTNIAPPPRKPSSMAYAGRLGGEIGLKLPADNMKDETLAPLNFKVLPEMHRRYKTAAAQTGKTMREILEESFELWIEKQMK